MRISSFEKEIIIREARRWFGQNCRVLLFGSRTNDAKQGGDIDLFIVPSDKNNLYMNKIHFLAAIKSEIGDQKIDVVVQYGEDDDRMIVETARREGIELSIRK
ncbi:nucleotidyltransferase domain-containing protein [Anaerophaga thermohalophila]|uniref:nucleotidyltransferase domain-containing protein n=1 Tax=Anaerophaga thermohalophila TaxID=177400 RepID=UPI000237BB21|nr:nucleotidyltransferase domain-containing protein [Anaerophaga thermohalophila]